LKRNSKRSKFEGVFDDCNVVYGVKVDEIGLGSASNICNQCDCKESQEIQNWSGIFPNLCEFQHANDSI
jgi:hypothetical protein